MQKLHPIHNGSIEYFVSYENFKTNLFSRFSNAFIKLDFILLLLIFGKFRMSLILH